MASIRVGRYACFEALEAKILQKKRYPYCLPSFLLSRLREEAEAYREIKLAD